MNNPALQADPLAGLTPYAREVFDVIAANPGGLSTDEIGELLPHLDMADHVEHAMTTLGPIHRNLVVMGRRNGTMRAVYRTHEAHAAALRYRKPFRKAKTDARD